MTTFNEHSFEKKLQMLKDSQDSIQSLSSWCLQHRQQHKKIVASWLKILKKVKVEHRLSLFYLANDVIQYSKRKSYDFVESWATALQRATPMVREEKVKHRILRIFKIWDERGIYDEAFIADLSDLLNPPAKKPPEVVLDPTDFQPAILFLKIRTCHTLENDTDLRLKRLNETHGSFSDADALRRHLKDRRQGDDMVAEVDDGVKKMEAYVKALQVEIQERKLVIEELDLAEKYYETQKGEAKIVVNAYKNFGNRVKVLKRNLDDLLPSFKSPPPPSPIPSPDVNAPSPSPDNDIELELPDDNAAEMRSDSQPEVVTIPGLGSDGVDDEMMENCFTSFIGNSLPFDIQKYTEITTVDLTAKQSEGKPIEVINSRTETEMEASLRNFLKSLGNFGNMSPSTAMPETVEISSPPPPHSEETYDVSENSVEKYPFESGENSATPMEPPPLPPSLFAFEDRGRNESWKSKLPAKFPSWEGESWDEESGTDWLSNKVADLETPESPPPCEKEGFCDPLEYDDVAATLEGSHDIDHRNLLHAAPLTDKMHSNSPGLDLPVHAIDSHTPQTDVDQRLLHIPLPSPHADVDHRTQILRKSDVDHRTPTLRNSDIDHRPQLRKDIDHRNLISLTGSPGPERDIVPPIGDLDYRALSQVTKSLKVNNDRDYRIPPPPPPPLPVPVMFSKPLNAPILPFDENRDNVESVDMDMSDEEIMDQHMGAEISTKKEKLSDPRNPMINNTILTSQNKDKDNDKPMVSFNINNQNNKLVGVSPLNEAMEDNASNRRIPVLQSPPPVRGSLLPTPPNQTVANTRPHPAPNRPNMHPFRPPFRPHMGEPLRPGPPHMIGNPRQHGPRTPFEMSRQPGPPQLYDVPRHPGPTQIFEVPRQQGPPHMFESPRPHGPHQMFDVSRHPGPRPMFESPRPGLPQLFEPARLQGPHQIYEGPPHIFELPRQQGPRPLFEPPRQQGPRHIFEVSRQQGPPQLFEASQQQGPSKIVEAPKQQKHLLDVPIQKTSSNLVEPPRQKATVPNSPEQPKQAVVAPKPVLSPPNMQPILEMINDLPADACDKILEGVSKDLDFTEDNCWIEEQAALALSGDVEEPEPPKQTVQCPPEQEVNKGRDPRNLTPVETRDFSHPLPFENPIFREIPMLVEQPAPEWIHPNLEWHNEEFEIERVNEWNISGPPPMAIPSVFNHFGPNHIRGGFNPRLRVNGRPYHKGIRRGGPPRGMPFGPRGGFRPPFMGRQGNFSGW